MSNQDQNDQWSVLHIIKYVSPAEMLSFVIFIHLPFVSSTLYGGRKSVLFGEITSYTSKL